MYNPPLLPACKTKIVCTLGPAVASQQGIQSLVDAGMDVARMNLSHGSYADHERPRNPLSWPSAAASPSPPRR